MGLIANVSHKTILQTLEQELQSRSHSFTPDEIKRIGSYGRIIGCRVHHHKILPRGMDLAREMIVSSEARGISFASGTVILAETLTAGKGRFGRDWYAPAGGLWLTVIIANTLLKPFAGLLPLAAGVACCEAARVSGVKARIKWVNDVHYQNRKLAGILTESYTSVKFKEEFVLLGIGINVNNEEFPEELGDTAVSLTEVLEEKLDLSAFCNLLAAKLAWNYGLLCNDEANFLATDECLNDSATGVAVMPFLLERWRQLSDTPGRLVTYGFDVRKNPLYQAKVIDITTEGALILEMEPDRKRRVELAGEIVYRD